MLQCMIAHYFLEKMDRNTAGFQDKVQKNRVFMPASILYWSHPPYDQIGIKILTYGSSNEAKEKFVIDTFTLQGTNKILFICFSNRPQSKNRQNSTKARK